MSVSKRILLIEHRSFVRLHLKHEMEAYEDIEIVGVAKDLTRGYELCRDKAPNIIVMDGRSFLREDRDFACKMIAMRPMQIIALADDLVYDELIAMNQRSMCIHNLILLDKSKILESLLDIVGAALRHDRMMKAIESNYYQKIEKTYTKAGDPVIAIGASTGGVSAIEQVITGIRGDAPPILMVQHMSKTFTGKMAERLCKLAKMEVKEAEDGEYIRNNVAYLAPGDQHMTVEAYKGNYRIRLDHGPLVHYQRPAVEKLFESVAKEIGDQSIGVILTGMGRDGAQGLLQMREAGAYTIAQDAASCVVFGMPRAAIELDAACEITSVDEVAGRLMELSAVTIQTEEVRDAVG